MLPMSDKLGSVNVDQMVALVREFKGKDGKKIIPLARPRPPGPPPPETITAPATIPKTPIKEIVETAPVPAPSGELADRIRRGAIIFRQYCITCHGEDGTGSPQRHNFDEIPDFTKPSWQDQKQNAQLVASILNGKGTHMPAHGDKISEDEARDLVAQVRSFGPKTVSKGPEPGPARQSDFEEKVRKLREQYEALEKELQKVKGPPKP
jgi:mono/diheme cytochrome c family protein